MNTPYGTQFANVGTSFGDWQRYAGLNQPKEREQQAAIAPPQTFSDVMSQAIAPVQRQYTNLTNAASQLGQGNVVGAYNASKGLEIQQPATAMPSSVSEAYDHNW